MMDPNGWFRRIASFHRAAEFCLVPELDFTCWRDESAMTQVLGMNH